MKLSPSILGVNNPIEFIRVFEEQQVDYLHIDVMDGKFVENSSFSVEEIKKISGMSQIPLDIHLMVENPIEYIENLNSISDMFTIHYEAFRSHEEVKTTLEYMREAGLKVGLSIKPNTSVDKITDLLRFVDLVLVMSVEPGKGGQSFIDDSLNKIGILRSTREILNYSYLIEVDGGINKDNADLVINAGADILVIGSFFTKNIDELPLRISLIRECAHEA